MTLLFGTALLGLAAAYCLYRYPLGVKWLILVMTMSVITDVVLIVARQPIGQKRPSPLAMPSLFLAVWLLGSTAGGIVCVTYLLFVCLLLVPSCILLVVVPLVVILCEDWTRRVGRVWAFEPFMWLPRSVIEYVSPHLVAILVSAAILWPFAYL